MNIEVNAVHAYIMEIHLYQIIIIVYEDVRFMTTILTGVPLVIVVLNYDLVIVLSIVPKLIVYMKIQIVMFANMII